MKDFVLDRSRWLRGEGAEESFLLRPSDGKMCCLGLYLESCGTEREDLLGKRYPAGARQSVPEEARWTLVDARTTDADVGPLVPDNGMIADANDAPVSKRWTEPLREAWIRAAFAARGVNVVFVDGPLPPSGPGQKEGNG